MNKKEDDNSLPLGFENDVVFIGGRGTKRMHCFAFVMFTIIAASSIIFLCLTFVKANQYVILRRYCIKGDANLVFPPGSSPYVGNPLVYFRGPMAFQRTEPYIEWDLYHSLIPSIGSLDILGPVELNNPLSGPLYLRLCETGTDAPCIFNTAYNMRQRITSVPLTGHPLDDLVDHIVDKPHQFIVVLNQALSNGTLVPVFAALLDSLC